MKFTIPKYSSGLQQLGGEDRVRIFITALVFLGVALLYHFEVLNRFELVTYDTRFILKGTRPADPRIAVIEISEDSVQKIGRWPWDRSWHATLIKILNEMGAKAVIFDVLFSEASDANSDAALAQSIQQSGNVYLAQVLQGKDSEGREELLKSLPEFSEYAKGAGHINLHPDPDGVMRRIALTEGFQDTVIPQLSFAVALDEVGAKLDQILIKDQHLVIPLKNKAPLEIPLDHEGNFIINWTGRWKDTFLHYSYVDVVASYAAARKGGKPIIPLESFKGKLCYVGTTAAGLFDIRPTPLEPAYPAVGVNLTVLNNLLEQKFIKKLNYGQNLTILIFLMLALFQIMKLKSYFKTAVTTAVIAFGYVIIAIALFVYFDVWVNIIYPLALILATYFFITLYDQLSVTVERAKLLKLATRDSLTGLYNVGHFKLLLKAEITTIAMRREKSLSIVMSDVDNFKKTNDTYGHVIGDSVLREVGDAFKTNCRALDVAARYGGEEFILMLPGADADIAYKIADKIR